MQIVSPTRRAGPVLKPLDSTYQARAIPLGTRRYWSWLFAAAETRAPLLGIYALSAEWQALLDPAVDAGVAHLKLAWWQEEMQRLAAASPVHPIGAYLAALPRAAVVDFAPLQAAVVAAAAQLSGVPLERGADLEPQSQALWGGPLALASRLAAESEDDASLRSCTAALAAAEYLSKALRGYRREARAGRVPFAIEELMAAGVENADLAADTPPAALRNYLDQVRARAAEYFDAAAKALPRAEQGRHRHLLVLAALGLHHLSRGAQPPPRGLFKDMLLAWKTARRAQS
jgi:15-cis-phytoene synthase